MNHFISSFLLLVLLILSCSQNEQEVIETEELTPLDTGMFTSALFETDSNSIIEQLAKQIASFQISDTLPLSDSAFIERSLQLIYTQNNFKPIWIYDSRADSAISEMTPGQHGLKKEDMLLDVLFERIQTIATNETVTDTDWADLDIAFSRSMLWWGKVLAHGKVDPTTVHEIWNFEQEEFKEPIHQRLLQAVQEHDLSSYTAQYAPQSVIYRQVKDQYALTIQNLGIDSIKEQSDSWEKIILKNTNKLVPGDSNAAVPELAERLALLEYIQDIPADSVLNQRFYAPYLQEAIGHFQREHGLKADSVIGKSTLIMLNMNRDQRIAAMKCTLERLRWIDHYLDGEFILVNVPQYKMYYLRADSLTWSSKVIVGTTWNKTPSMTAEIERLVFNPTWTVPYSISSKEILPKLKKDSTHLMKQNMELIDRSGNVIPSTTIDYTQYNKDSFPYIIRQKPGGENSLGLVKFHMPNPYYIFMHDTPGKSKFRKDQRTYSHGCIRLENPFELAEILLSETPEFKPDTIQGILNTGVTTNYSLEEPIPILVLYFTYFIDSEGNSYTLSDVYGRDEKLLSKL